MEHAATRKKTSTSRESAANKTKSSPPAREASENLNASAATGTSSEPLKPDSLLPVADPLDQWINRRASAQALRAAQARQVSGRRRFVDPCTCDRDYTTTELEFMRAMHDYKHRSGRMFPTWSEILEVLRALGYRKVPSPTADESGEDASPRRRRKTKS